MRRGAAAAEAFPESVARLRAALGELPGAGRLWPALAALDWAAALPSGAAPGFVYLAGAVDGVPVGGGGRELVEAAGRLAGEASEALIQAAPGEAADLPGDPAIEEVWGDGPLIAAVNLARGRLVGVPMGAVHRDAAAPELGATPPRGLGLAAGPDREAARLAATLELVERDAAARWWTGETRPRGVCVARGAGAAADLAGMRAGAADGLRPTAFLALPSPVGLPVVCAYSRDPGGSGLAFGLKAALSIEAAAAGAVRELLQMEIALEIARMRAAQGRETPHDARLLRAAALDPDAYAAFAPLPPEGGAAPASPSDFHGLVAHLAGHGLETTIADLGGEEGGPRVAKAFVPGLRPLPDPRAPSPRPGAPGEQAELV